MFTHGTYQAQSTERIHQGRSDHYRVASRLRRRTACGGVHGEATLGRSSSLPALWLGERLSNDGLQRPGEAASQFPLALPREGMPPAIHSSYRYCVRGQPRRATPLVLRVLARGYVEERG